MKTGSIKRTSPAGQQKQCDAFNAKNPIGQMVNVRMDNGSEITTKTTSEAQLLGGHTAVVWLEGISGAYLLNRVSVA